MDGLMETTFFSVHFFTFIIITKDIRENVDMDIGEE
jgi:hypothetical protein